MAGKSLIGALRVTLGLDSAEFTKGAAKSKKEMSGLKQVALGLGAALATIVTSQAITQWKTQTRAALDMAGAIGETAQQVGVSAEALQKYRIVAIGAGIDQEKLEKNLAQLTKRLGAAALGTKAQAKAFEEMGIKIRDADGKIRSTEDILLDIAEAAKNAKNEAELHAMASKLMGKGAQDMIPFLSMGADEIKRIGDEADRSGRILSNDMVAGADEAADALADLENQMAQMRAKELLKPENIEALKNYERSMSNLELSFYKGMKALDDFALASDEFTGRVHQDTQKAIADNIRLFASLPGRISEFGQRTLQAFFDFTGRAIGSVRNLYNGVRDWLQVKLGATMEWLRGKLSDAGDWFFQLYDRVVGHSYIPDMVDEIGAEMKRLDTEMIQPINKATSKAAELFRELQGEVAGILARLFPEAADRNRFDAELASLNRYFDALKKSGGDALKIERQRLAAVEALNREYAGLDRDRMAVAPGDVYPEIESQSKSVEELNRELIDNSEEALGKLRKQADVTRVQVVESFTQMIDGALSQIDRFVKGIKSGNWLDIIGGLLQSIDKIAAIATGGKGTSIGPFNFGNTSGGTTSVPRFATGGSMTLGGFSGIDRNLLSMNGQPLARVSRGEDLTITPANDRGTGREEITFRAVKGDLFDVIIERKVTTGVAQAAPAIANAGANQALSMARRQQARALD